MLIVKCAPLNKTKLHCQNMCGVLMICNSCIGWFYYSFILGNTAAISTDFTTASALCFLN